MAEASDKAPPAGPLEGTKEEQLAAWEARPEMQQIMEKHPEVDFKNSVMEPTLNFGFAAQEALSEDMYKKYSELMAKMMEVDDVADVEKLLFESRACLEGHPVVQAQFDDLFIKGKPMSEMCESILAANQARKQFREDPESIRKLLEDSGVTVSEERLAEIQEMTFGKK